MTQIGPFQVAVSASARFPGIPAGTAMGDLLLVTMPPAAMDGWTAKATPGDTFYYRRDLVAPFFGPGLSGKIIAIKGAATSGDPFDAVGFASSAEGSSDGETITTTTTATLTTGTDGALALFKTTTSGSASAGAMSGAAAAVQVGGVGFGFVTPAGVTSGSVVWTLPEDVGGSVAATLVALRPAGAEVIPPGSRGRYYGQGDPLSNDRGLVRLDIFRMWKKTRGSAASRLCAVDTGYVDHADLPSLTGNEWNESLGLANGHDQANTSSAQYGHGTGVASILYARAGNGVGAAGIASGCTPQMISVVTPGMSSWTKENALDAIKRAARAAGNQGGFGAHVISISLGTTGAEGTIADTFYGPDTAEAWTRALLFAAAGNEATDLAALAVGPAESTNVICVGAIVADTDEPQNYSNFGVAVDLAAPPDYTAAGPGGTYRTFDGTSSTTPACAAIGAAAVRSVNPALTTDEAYALLRATGDAGRHARFAVKFPNAKVPLGGKAAAASLATLPGGLEVYARFLANSATPWSVTTVDAGTATTTLDGDCSIEILGFKYNAAAPTLPLDADMVELWLDDACVFAGKPQTLRCAAFGAGTPGLFRLVARAGEKVSEESFDDVVASSLSLIEATYALTAAVKSKSGNAATLTGSRVPGRPLPTVAGGAATATSALTWEAPVALAPGVNLVTVSDGTDSLTVTAQGPPRITVNESVNLGDGRWKLSGTRA